MTLDNDVNNSIRNYINNNVIDRYKLSRVDLFIEYKDLRSQNILRYENSWNQEVSNNLKNKNINFQSDTYSDGSYTKITFSQEMPSSLYSFDYFFNIIFEKV